MTPAERRPAEPICNEPEQAFAEHQDHSRDGGEDRCHGHDRFRTKVRENQMKLMHLTCLPANEDRIKNEWPVSHADIFVPPAPKETGTVMEMCLHWSTGALRATALSPSGPSHRGDQERMLTVVWQNDWPVRGEGRQEDSTVYAAERVDQRRAARNRLGGVR